MTFVVLYNHDHHLGPDPFDHPIAIKQSLAISPSPAPADSWSTWCLCGFPYLAFHINGTTQHMAFVSDLFHIS